MTNKELLQPLKEAFPDLWGGYWPEYPGTRYSNEYIREQFTNVILKLGRPPIHADPDYSILSVRQLYLATAVYELLRKENVGDAIHQFMDCIDNFGEATASSRNITTIEHLVYYGMAYAILIAVDK